eukprot:818683-Pyramimonas_sp.AAC.1
MPHGPAQDQDGDRRAVQRRRGPLEPCADHSLQSSPGGLYRLRSPAIRNAYTADGVCQAVLRGCRY